LQFTYICLVWHANSSLIACIIMFLGQHYIEFGMTDAPTDVKYEHCFLWYARFTSNYVFDYLPPPNQSVFLFFLFTQKFPKQPNFSTWRKSCHQVRGRVHRGQVSSPSQGHTDTNETNNRAHSHSLPINYPAGVFLDCRRKLEWPTRHKLHTERAQLRFKPGAFLLWGDCLNQHTTHTPIERTNKVYFQIRCSNVESTTVTVDRRRSPWIHFGILHYLPTRLAIQLSLFIHQPIHKKSYLKLY